MSQFVFLMTSWVWKTRCQYFAGFSPSAESPAGSWWQTEESPVSSRFGGEQDIILSHVTCARDSVDSGNVGFVCNANKDNIQYP